MCRRLMTWLTGLVLLVGCVPVSGPKDSGTDAGTDDAGNLDAGAPRDLDIAVARFNADGTPDHSFGDGGVFILDFGAASGSARDTVYSLTGDQAGRLVLFGSTKAQGRADVDRYVARLTADGRLDSAFANAGVHLLDAAGTNDAARHGFIQADGKIVAAGYSPLPSGVALADGGPQLANEIVLLRLDTNGTADPTFGTAGVVMTPHFTSTSGAWGFAESYGVVPQSGGRYVTIGYGRAAAAGTVDIVSFRYSNQGAVDQTWGRDGGLVVDLIGGDDRARHGVALPDDRVVLVGSGTATTDNIDALVAITTPSGSLDSTFGTQGIRTFSFGRADEAFFGAAVGPGAMTLAAVGYRAGPANTASENDDAVLTLLPLTVGAPAEVTQAVPLSTSTHDRFFGVAWSGTKVVAVGFVRDGNDTQMAIARFTADGQRDTTFGSGGLSTLNVAVGAGTEEVARWVFVQADGKIVIAGPVEH